MLRIWKLNLLALAIAMVQCEEYSSGGHDSIELPVYSEHHEVSHHEIHPTGKLKPTNVEVGPSNNPINLDILALSNPTHLHRGVPGSYHASHMAHKPAIKEVHEIVLPHRILIQNLRSLNEAIQSQITKHTANWFRLPKFLSPADH